MKVNVVGTSCSWFKRNNTSYIIDDNIVLDTPSGSYKDVIKCIDVLNLKCIFISHFHTDHFSDLHIFATRFMREGKRLNKKYKIYGPKGIFDKLIDFNRLLCGGKDETDKESYKENVEFIELYDGMEIKEGKYNIKAYKMEHGEAETYGFTFTEGNKTIGFSTDTAPCENLNKILTSSNYAFVDFASMKKHNTHICVDDFELILKNFPKTKIFPIHTSDATQEYSISHGFNYLNDGDILNF